MDALVPELNLTAREGIENPAIGFKGLTALDVDFGDKFIVLLLLFGE